MSTYYLPDQPIPFDKIKGMKGEVREEMVEFTTPSSACLTNGKNRIWAQRASNGYTQFARYGDNNVEGILDHLAKQFKVAFVSEYDAGFDELAEDYDYIKFQF